MLKVSYANQGCIYLIKLQYKSF